jgi:hypothetical protein
MAQASTGSTLEEVLNSYPDEFKPAIDRGLTELRTAQAQPEKMFEVALELYQQGGLMERADLERSLGISLRSNVAVSNALGFSLGIASRSESVDEICHGAVELGLVSDENSNFFKALVAQFKANAPKVGRLMNELALADRLLPSLHGMEAVVDVRFGFKGSSPAIAVPVAILYFETDVGSQALWCQATLETLKGIMNNLERLVGYLETSKKLAAGLISKTEGES